MKFAKVLGAHITPEWRKQYVQYQRFHKIIYSHINFMKHQMQMLFRMVEMIEKYKQSVPEEEFAENTVIERGEAKFIVSKINTK